MSADVTRARAALLAVIAEREAQLWPEDIKTLRAAEGVLAQLDRSDREVRR